jgi:prevent-host-death family protein
VISQTWLTQLLTGFAGVNEYVNIHQAKTGLSKLIDRVESGEEIVIARGGKPAAKLVPLTTSRGRRGLALLDGKFPIPEAFNAPLPNSVIREFERSKRRDFCLTLICCFGRRQTATLAR